MSLGWIVYSAEGFNVIKNTLTFPNRYKPYEFKLGFGEGSVSSGSYLIATPFCKHLTVFMGLCTYCLLFTHNIAPDGYNATWNMSLDS